MSEIFAGDELLERLPDHDEVREWTDLLARRVSQGDEGEALSVLVFRIGDELLAMRTADFHEVVEMQPAHRVPHRDSSALRGLVNIRGRLELCVALGSLLGILGLEESLPTSQLLLAGRDNARFAFIIDEVRAITQVPQAELMDYQAGALVRSAFLWEQRMVGLLESDAVHAALMERIGR